MDKNRLLTSKLIYRSKEKHDEYTVTRKSQLFRSHLGIIAARKD